MVSEEIIKAAKDHNVPVSWVEKSYKIYDVFERGLDFACYYGVAKFMHRVTDHAECMKKAIVYLNSHRSNVL